ncbi:UDP-glucose 4-epimerase [Xylaria telfairii]|nr:UDP-glucose 4-epimerase [Xylaria telfairii]
MHYHDYDIGCPNDYKYHSHPPWLLSGQGRRIIFVGGGGKAADLTDSGQVFNALTNHFSFDDFGDGKPPGTPDVTNTVSTYSVIEAASKLVVQKIIIASIETVYSVCFAEGDMAHDHFPFAQGFARRFGNYIYALRIGKVIEPKEYKDRVSRDYWREVGQGDTRKRNAWSYVDARDLGQVCDLCIQQNGLGFQVFNAANNRITALEAALRGREMGMHDAPLSNKKVRDVLGSKEKYNWINYLPT